MRRAFSLVEMLVAVLLLTLMIGVAIFAFKYQLMAIAKTKKVGINRVIAYSQLRGSLESIKFYVVDDYDILNKPMKNLHHYFDGTSTSINYITQNPLFSKETSLVNLTCRDTTLLYTEQKLYGTMDFLRPELNELSRELTLYKDLQKCQFRYHYLSIQTNTMSNSVPTAIEIELQTNEIQNTIHVNIASDYNRSIYMIYDAIYPDE